MRVGTDPIYEGATIKTLGGIIRTHVKAARKFQREADALIDNRPAYQDRSAFVTTALNEFEKVAAVLEDGAYAQNPQPSPQAESSVWPAVALGFVAGAVWAWGQE